MGITWKPNYNEMGYLRHEGELLTQQSTVSCSLTGWGWKWSTFPPPPPLSPAAIVSLSLCFFFGNFSSYRAENKKKVSVLFSRERKSGNVEEVGRNVVTIRRCFLQMNHFWEMCHYGLFGWYS